MPRPKQIEEEIMSEPSFEDRIRANCNWIKSRGLPVFGLRPHTVRLDTWFAMEFADSVLALLDQRESK